MVGFGAGHMRILISFLAGMVMLCSGPLFAAETDVTTDETVAPRLTAEQPINPKSDKPGAPVLTLISARLGPRVLNMTPQMIIPEFHFVAPNGNAVLLHRELVTTNANNLHINPVAAINIPADAQKNGAVISGGWTCGKDQYYATMSAYIMDADGNRSNSVRYTVHCNGG